MLFVFLFCNMAHWELTSTIGGRWQCRQKPFIDLFTLLDIATITRCLRFAPATCTHMRAFLKKSAAVHFWAAPELWLRCHYLPEFLCMAPRITVSLLPACTMGSVSRSCLYTCLGLSPVNDYLKDLLSLCLKSANIAFTYAFFVILGPTVFSKTLQFFFQYIYIDVLNYQLA